MSWADAMSLDTVKICITPGCDKERMIKRDGSAYSSHHCSEHVTVSVFGGHWCAFGCGVDRRKHNGHNTSNYCVIHDRMKRALGSTEAKEWYAHGKLWLPSGTRRDARTGDGCLYVLKQESSGLVIIGIAAGRALVEHRTATHERYFTGLEQLEVRDFKSGGAYRLESRIKTLMKQSDHYPYVPKGTYKWTEVFAYHEFEPVYQTLTGGCD